MTPMNGDVVTVTVDLPGRAYPVRIGQHLLASAGAFVRACSRAARALVVTDSNVGPLYAAALQESLQAAGFESELITVPPGDASKSLPQAAQVYDVLAARRHDRGEPIIALGGGMVGDLAGFVAATWLRGVPFVQCPTTVEADVDASVGGKTAVNHPMGKNLIGCFHQPVLVCIDLDCLRTVSRRDFVAGLAESVKHAIIRDSAFFEWHEAHAAAILAARNDILQEFVYRNCRCKAAVVVADERETATTDVGRAALNLGHTIGHAIETQCNYELRHGEAVGLGLVAAMDLAVRCVGFPDPHRQRVEALLARLELPIRASKTLDCQDILRRLGADKKVRDRTVRFIVPVTIGAVRWLDAPAIADVEQAIQRLLAPMPR
jgi:3-dehydroquinate synthase